jgi:hypothetical protein
MLIALLCTVLFACNKTDHFYEQLEGTPELATLSSAMYSTAYKVGDTMKIYGLQVKIGDAAPMQAESRPGLVILGSNARVTYDCIKVVITKEMGIGSNRPVTITGGGITLYCPAIEIYENAGIALSDSLKIISYAALPANAVLFYCRDGRGSIYMYDNGSVHLLRNGQTQTVLAAYADQQGSFSITRMFSGGVDRANKFLYFSALTEDGQSDNATHLIFRLCRVDLQSKEITTLNRTLVPKKAKLISEDTYLPWEGDISQVKIIGARNIAPAEDGNVFMMLNCPITIGPDTTVISTQGSSSTDFHAIARIDPAGKVTYLFRRAAQYGPWVLTPGSTWLTTTVKNFPGTLFNNVLFTGIESISPDEKLFYVLPMVWNGSQGVNLYDLEKRVQLYEYRKERLGTGEIPQFIGPFRTLKNGWYFSSNYSAWEGWGLMPMPGQRVLLLFFQSLGGSGSRELYHTPAWSTLDFAHERGDLYAPSYCDLGKYAMYGDDLLLNYDESGHLYMTANSRKEFVKTAPR